jgi:hypothetical protein
MTLGAKCNCKNQRTVDAAQSALADAEAVLGNNQTKEWTMGPKELWAVTRPCDISPAVFGSQEEAREHAAIVLNDCLGNVHGPYRRTEQLEEIMHWAQATLTALNVGSVVSESPLHKKLREVLIAYREQANAEAVLKERTDG